MAASSSARGVPSSSSSGAPASVPHAAALAQNGGRCEAGREEGRSAVCGGSASSSGRQLDIALAELEVKSCRLTSALEEAEEELRQRSAERDVSKGEWSRALGQAATSEGREERRVTAFRQELQELRTEEEQEALTFQLEREKLRQRVRSLRMRQRQAERQQDEAHGDLGLPEDADACGAGAWSSRRGGGSSGSSARAVGGVPGRAVAGAGRPGTGSARGHAAYASHASPTGSPRIGGACGGGAAPLIPSAADLQDAAAEAVAELRGRREELLAGELELQASERGLRRSSRLSDRELQHWRLRAELTEEEATGRQRQAQLRSELCSLDAEADRQRGEAVEQRRAQERYRSEAADGDLAYQALREEEAEALCKIDAYLTENETANIEDRQARLAEWIEADVSVRQAELVRQRLAEVVADAGARAQVLEQAVAQLHADLDRRAAIILELLERQGQQPSASGAANPGGGPRTSHVHLLRAPAEAAGAAQDAVASLENEDGEDEPETEADEDEVAAAAASPASLTAAACGGADSLVEREALEAELEHQRGLFDLRGEQVQGLEHRLAALLAREAPRVHKLRAWIAVHEPLARQRLAACAAFASGGSSGSGGCGAAAVYEDVVEMRRDKHALLVEAETQWRLRRHWLEEAELRARRDADAAATAAASLQRRRDGVAKTLEKLLRADAALAERVAAAGQAVARDNRRLVDLTARQLRVASAAAASRGDLAKAPGSAALVPFGGVDAQARRAEAARQSLADAREAVEETRGLQVQALLSIQEESAVLQSELASVNEALESAEAAELGQANRAAGDANGQNWWPPAAGESGGAAALQRRGFARLRTRLEHDLETAVNQLRQAERAHAGVQQCLEEAAQRALLQMQEASSALAQDRQRLRSSSSGVLRRYRAAHSAVSEAEQRCRDLRAMRDGVQSQVAETRRRGSQRNLRKGSTSSRERFASPPVQTQAQAQPGSRLRPRSQPPPDAAQQLPPASAAAASAPSAAAREADVEASEAAEVADGADACGADVVAVGCGRPLLSIEEVQARSLERPQLYSFYLQVLPLLRGAALSAYRRPSQRFEPRQLLLSSDFQRLELWPTPATSGDLGGEPTAAAPPPAAGAEAAGRGRRLAEAFVRVESLVRLHVPRSTLLAATQPSAPSPPPAATGAAQREDLCETGSPTRVASSSPSRGKTVGEEDFQGLQSPLPERLLTWPPAAPVAGARPAATPTLTFELVLEGADPWRLLARDAQTFRAVAAALGALLSARASLPGFAAALSLGAADLRAGMA
eukprot:TRINITY_DN14871_c0_g6_i1.p1 TRINITY_DN14871_c0_g6~~TRINITY_DN14871_c0_g6_i1.p1  ORF type:complete len:1334 (+),score=418.16 TRINITY_DN14871_c0_g6_i1:160-4002(+)